jgi:hypothetical protein
MILNKQVLYGKGGFFIKLAYKLSDISNKHKADIKLLPSEKNIIKFVFGVDLIVIFEDELLSEIKSFCKEKELKLKTKKLKKTTLCQILLG